MLHKALLSRIGILEHSTRKQILLLMLKSIGRTLFYNWYANLQLDRDRSKILVFSNNRSDLANLCNHFSQHLSVNKEFLRIRFEWKKLLILIGVLAKYKKSKMSFQNAFDFINQHSAFDIDLKRKILIRCWFLELIVTFYEAQKAVEGYQHIFMLQEMNFPEFVLAVAARESGIKTTAFQHGLYRDTGKLVSSVNTNPINYLLCPCEDRLCWGEFSLNIFGRYLVKSSLGESLPLQSWIQTESGIPDRTGPPVNLLAYDSIQQHRSNLSMEQMLNEAGVNHKKLYHPDYGETNNFDFRGKNLIAVYANNSSVILKFLGRVETVYLLNSSDFLKGFIGSPMLQEEFGFITFGPLEQLKLRLFLAGF